MVYNVIMNSEHINAGVPDDQKQYYNFDLKDNQSLSSEENSLHINGKIVGKNPKFFNRSESYHKNFEKLGSGSENIKVINNFLSEEECKNFVTFLKTKEVTVTPIQWDHEFKPIATKKFYPSIKESIKYIDPVKDELEKAFDVKVNSKSAAVVRWDEGDKLELHVDDLGTTDYNHMATLIYLNDDYEGGEIYFPTHGISLKPKAGDLLMFPGNMHYAHGVTPVMSGYRYTIPMWFEFA